MASAPISAAEIVVLPLPECGAAMQKAENVFSIASRIKNVQPQDAKKYKKMKNAIATKSTK